MSDKSESLPVLAPSETRDLLKAAIEKGGVDAIERVAALYERSEARAAARSYHGAMTRFSAAMRPIEKTAQANIVSKTGAKFGYTYAPLDTIARAISEPLKDAGLSYTWDSEFKEGMISVICTVRHIDGHTQTATFTCPTESPAGMSAQQKVAAALTFGRRQSLVQALGLSSCDADSDGANPPSGGEVISDKEAADLDCLIGEVDADCVKFLTWLKVDSIQEIQKSDYLRAVRALEQKRKW